MNKTTAITVIVVALIAVGAYAMFAPHNSQLPQQNITVPYGAGTQTTTQQTSPVATSCPAGQQMSPTQAGVCIPIGQLTINLVETNALLNTAALVEGTNLDTIYLKSTDGINYVKIGSGTGNTISLDPTMKGIFYAQVKPHSGSHYYVAPSLIMNPALNPSITGFDFVDTSGSGQKNWVFRVDLSHANLPPIAGGQTAPVLTLYWLAYQYGALTLASSTTSPIAGSSTPETSNTIQYYGTLAAIEEANAVSSIEVKVNTTTTTKVDSGNSYVQIPNLGPGGGVQTVYLSQMTPTKDSSNLYWDYYLTAAQSASFMTPATVLQTNLKGADFVTVGAVGANSIPFTANIVTNLGASDAIKVTMTVTSLDDTQAPQTSAKSINICTQAGCGP